MLEPHQQIVLEQLDSHLENKQTNKTPPKLTYSYNRIQLSNKKEQTIHPCDNMGESQKHSAEQKKSGVKSTSCMIYSYETVEKTIDDDGKQTNSYLGLGVRAEGGGRSEGWLGKEKGNFGVMGMFYILIVAL